MPKPAPKNPFAKRSLGQNFLVDPLIIQKIIDVFDPSAADRVVEIGPGRGALTERLIGRVGRLYALEFDRDLIPVLRAKFGNNEGFELIGADALSFDLSTLVPEGERIRVIANLPYNISTAILQGLGQQTEHLADCVLMFQREVVERISAQPGDTNRGYLTVLTELSFSVEKVFDVPPAAFRPVPKVWSSVVRLVPKTDVAFDHGKFREIVSAGFAQKRKTILNNLKIRYTNAASMLAVAGIDTRRRAETLTLEEWVTLASVNC